MHALFPEYYRPSDGEFVDLWNRGIIALDTNILLGLYRFTKSTRDALLDTFGHAKIVDRLWIPNRVGVEFYRNRPKVIIDQNKVAESFRVAIEKTFGELETELKKLVTRYHPFIERDAWEKRLSQVAKKLQKDLHNAGKDAVDVSDDLVLKRIDALFHEKVSLAPEKTTLEKRTAEGERRIKDQVPPGFADAKKEAPDRVGDYLIWSELIEESSRRQLPMIFVIDDAKEDWWHRVSGRTLGPHPALRREFLQDAKQLIYFYSSEQFLARAGEFIGTPPKPTVIEELILNIPKFKRSPLVNYDFHSPPDDADGEMDDEENEPAEPEGPSTEEMVNWFFRRFEDPANGVPHDSGEGGYQYVNGGPYDPLEELSDQFSDAPQERLEEAANRIYSDGHEWVKIGQY